LGYQIFLDTEHGDLIAKEQIEKIVQNVTKALMDDVEGSAGVVSKEVRMFREKQMKLEREKK